MYVINESCIACGACVGGCPVEAIVMDEALGRYAIDPDKCISCGACAGGCPVEAIIME